MPDVRLPKPFPTQLEIIKHPAKRKILIAGRRYGKTEVGSIDASIDFLHGKRVLLTSTTQDQADIFWERLKRYLAPLFHTGYADKNEGRRIIEGGKGLGLLRIKTGRDPDTLRGGDWDKIIVDETALLDPDAWYSVFMPMLLDTNGSALLMGSPRRRNWFYHLYHEAQLDTTGTWQTWHKTTMDNPHITQEALAILIRDMPQDIYKQEILAEFISEDGVFKNVWDSVYSPMPTPYRGMLFMGLDWGRYNDFTVMVLLDANTGKVVAWRRIKEMDWATQRAAIINFITPWLNAQSQIMCLAESNSIGEPNIEALRSEIAELKYKRFIIQPFVMTATSKPTLINALQLAFERGEIKIPDDGIFIDEIVNYEVTASKAGRLSYSAPIGFHDDIVVALMLAWYAATIVNYRQEQSNAPIYLDMSNKIGNY